MRLHRLEISAFGPFAGTQNVDFDELSAAGLFLLHGPTGAGKTSVLDAVCFALYGQVPGARPANRLRSDHAAPGTPTEVVLELTVSGRRLEITRRPEQPRAKKRGSGTTMDKPVTLLRELDGGQWRGLSTSHQETGEEIKQLLGMSCEQFCQVVLLPQGEFATFLRAGAAERGALLGRLFDTRRFTSVESWLRDRRQETGQQLTRSDEELRQLGAALRQAAGHGADGGTTDDGTTDDGTFDTPAALLEWAARLRCDARERVTIAASAAAHAEAAHALAAAAHTEARDLHALQRRHREAADRAAVLAGQRPARDHARAALARAHRAATVEPALALRDKAATQQREAAALEADVLAELASSVDPLAPALPAARTAPDPDAGRAARAASALPHARTSLRVGEEPAAHAAPHRGAEALSGPAQDRARSGGAVQDPSAGAPSGTRPAARGADTPAGKSRTERPAFRGDGRDVASGRPDGASQEGANGAAASGRGEADGARDRFADPETYGGQARELRGVVGELGAAVEGEARLAEIAGRRDRLEREEAADDDLVREAREWLDQWPPRRAALQTRVDAAMEGAARAATLAAEVEAAKRRVDAAAERDRHTRQMAAADEDARDARDRAATSRERWQDLREARISGIAAELAAGLVDGAPCRVCGAEHHPDPAQPAAQQVSRADEDAAYADFQADSARYDQARDAAGRLAAAREAAATAAGDLPLPELVAVHKESAADHAAAGALAADAPVARAALARAEAEHDERAARQQEAVSRSAARTSRREELDEQHERLSRHLAEARAGYPTVAARRAALSDRVSLLERAERAVRERGDAEARLAEAGTSLAEAAARAGFATPGEAAAALLPPPRLWDAERQTEAWAKEEAALDAELAAPEPAAAAARPPADPGAAQAALDAANRRLQHAAAVSSAARSRCAELDRLSTAAASRIRELAPARAAFERVRRLAELAAGTSADNRYRMGLETYVLAARLEQVAAAAGVRLQRMSAGRYTLAHSDARGGGRARSGLGLVVVDAWTGTERDTSTLSGGETFFASLALALGLADVVTDESGGTRLDTLFIDEGFGSLDDQTLDEVLDVLDGLRERDRAVGIVSHVADLRHRVPVQLRVDKGRDGSTIRLRTTPRERAAR
ncbi:exonuclease SbcC [Actinacidiphila rubida]|uniref:Nuclease SbcCD subunit C n=3 Tax=Actinacidiphila rubida TaxID=310780 RepID=A0A1H8NG06_9ACTN|nr:AAA family ATPase [Actinacidiphila rubida]SEO28506.1 exonuclease SbcC [Actinacidiphila rubida]